MRGINNKLFTALVTLACSIVFVLSAKANDQSISFNNLAKTITDKNQDQKLSAIEIAHTLLKLGSSKSPEYDLDLSGTVDAQDLAIFEKAIADERMSAPAYKLIYLVDRNANRKVEVLEIVDVALGMFEEKDATHDPEYDINSDLIIDSKDQTLISSFARSFDTAYKTCLRAISAVDEDGDMTISTEEADFTTAAIETAYSSKHISTLAKYDLNYDESFDDKDNHILSYIIKQAKYKA